MKKTKFDNVSTQELETVVGGRHRDDYHEWLKHLEEFGKGFFDSFASTKNFQKGQD